MGGVGGEVIEGATALRLNCSLWVDTRGSSLPSNPGLWVGIPLGLGG